MLGRNCVVRLRKLTDAAFDILVTDELVRLKRTFIHGAMKARNVPHSRLCLRDLAAPGTNVRSGEAAPQRQSETERQLWADRSRCTCIRCGQSECR